MQQQSPGTETRPLASSLRFKNGALCTVTYSPGENTDGKGKGVLQWRSGHYRGEFLGLQRHGKGEQRWSDGSRYEGEFKKNLRDGDGLFFWSSGHEYDGAYRHDKRDGHGVYRWPSGASFTGLFSCNVREGFGTYVASTGEKFEGNYHNDIRDGEGVLTYPGGRQDVGIWRGSHLVQLKFPQVEADFRVREQSCVSLKSTDYTLRGPFGPRGYLETASSDLFQAAALGDTTRVVSILRGGAVYPDVVDSDGHSPLFVAAIHSQPQVVNVLLDNTANINRVDTSGISILSACLHLLCASSPAVKAVLFQKFHELACSNVSTPSSSSECTLHTSDFASTQSDISQLADREEVEKGSEKKEDKKEEEEEDGERISSSCSGLSSKQSSTHGSYRLLEFGEEEKEEGPFDQLRIASVESMITPASTATDLAQPCEEAWIENAELLTSAASGSSKLEVPANGEMTQEEAGLQRRVAENGQEGEDQAGISGLVEESTLSEEVIHHQIVLSPQGSAASRHATTPDTSPIVDVLSHSLSALGHVSSEVPSNRAPSDILNFPSPSSFSPSASSSCSSLSGICHHHSEKRRTREWSTASPPSVKLPTVTLNLPASSPLSYHFGPVVSAAQSTTIPLSQLSAPTSRSSLETSIGEGDHHTERSLREIVILLLKRGADPNISSEPLPPLFYAILAGDYDLACLMMDKGASLTTTLPHEIGGYLPLHAAVSLASPAGASIARALLAHGADPMLPAEEGCSTGEAWLTASEQKSLGHQPMLGAYSFRDSGVEHCWTSLHTACAVNKPSKPEVVLTCIELLVEHGSSINSISRGHSPLSLTIINGHDEAIRYLLSKGADPNLTLGLGVGSALCAVTTHMAHCKRTLALSIDLVHQLLANGANLLMSVKIVKNDGRLHSGTVVDYAYEAFKEDKRLSQLRYMALTKSERVRYKAAKKLTHYIVCLLRIKAVENVHGVEKLLMEPVPTSFEVPSQQLRPLPKHPMSATSRRQAPSTKAPPHSANKLLPILSAGAKRTGGCCTQLQLPVNTLRDSLKFIGAMHSLVETTLTHKSKNNSVTLPEVFERVKQLLKNSVEGDERWSLHSFCFKCGRRAGVQLTRCSGCGLVSFCSQHCKDESWRSGHALECSGSTHVHGKPAAKETKQKVLRNVHHHSLSDSKYHSVSGEYKRLTAVASQRIKSSITKYEHLTTILNSSA